MRQLATSLRQLEKLSQTSAGAQAGDKSEKLQEMKRQLSDLLARGQQVKIDLRTGLLVQAGIVGKRLSLRDFKWIKDVDVVNFDVHGRTWEDRTDPIKADSPADLIMIRHSAIWRPARPPGDSETRLLNIRTGETRRVAYQGMDSMPIAFGKDRRRVYVGGAVAEDAAFGLFEIDLETLKQRRLGLPLLGKGVVMFGAISPDGETIAVTHGATGENILQQQVVLVNLATGNARPIGEPIDCAHSSWLPDGSGLVMVSRKDVAPDKPPEGTIARMDLKGRLTLLKKGNNPVSLTPRAEILFEGKDSAWMTCDLNGASDRLVLDRLSNFNFPAPSPEGDRLLMMKFGGPDGPRPNIVNLKNKEITPVDVPLGFWGFPIW
jgi:hypothetical protein